MSSGTKTVLIVLLILLLLCGCCCALMLGAVRSAGWALSRGVVTGPANVTRVAGDIASFDLPSGYLDDFAADIAGFKVAGFVAGDSRGHIVFVSAPSWLHWDQAELERQLRQADQGRGGDQYTGLRTVGDKQVTIRGQQVTFTISEGANSEGQTYRMMNGTFQGQAGLTLVSMSAPLEGWDDATFDAFLASIR
jgi:hypothetical protein